MSERAEIEIKQIVVEVNGELCGVCLPQDRLNILAHYLGVLSEGPVKLVRLPGVKMVPLNEMQL